MRWRGCDFKIAAPGIFHDCFTEQGAQPRTAVYCIKLQVKKGLDDIDDDDDEEEEGE